MTDKTREGKRSSSPHARFRIIMQPSYSRSSQSGGQMATFCTYYEHRWPRGHRVKKKVPPKQVSVIILRERVCPRQIPASETVVKVDT